MNYPHYSNKYTSWQWLLDARKKYLKKFKVLNTDHMDLEKEIYIGVYGPTQVGKTTFVLTLLGIKSDCILKLSDALRGKQSYGKSATVTATVFKKSQDSYFYIFKDSLDEKQVKIKVKNLEKLELELKIIRDDITSGKLTSLDKVIIYISNTYFYNELIESQELSIVDLPGDDTKDEAEEEHVNSIISKYINLCKSIIIMELSSNITGLSQISIEAMEGWHKNPYKFSVVITRAISDASVNKFVLDREISSSKELSNHYKNELSRILHDNESETDDILRRDDTDYQMSVYPLELGESLDSLNANMDDDLYNCVKLWNSELLGDMIDYLKETETAEFQIKSLFNITNLIIKAKDKAFTVLVDKAEIIKIKIENLEVESMRLEEVIGLNNSNKESGLIKVVNDLKYNIKVVENLIEMKVFDGNYNDLHEKFSKATRQTQEFIDAKKLLLNFHENLEFSEIEVPKYDVVNEKYNVYLRELNTDISNQLKNLETHFNDSLNVNAFFSFGEAYTVIEDITKIRNISANKSWFRKRVKDDPYSWRLEHLKERLTDAIQYELKNLAEFIKKYSVTFESLLTENRNELHQVNKKIQDNYSSLEKIKKLTLEAEEKWEAELELGNQLNTFFINEYEDEMKKLIAQFNNTSSKDEEILIITQMNIITYQIERLVMYDSERQRKKQLREYK